MSASVYGILFALTVVITFFCSLLFSWPTLKRECYKQIKRDISVEKMWEIEKNIKEFYRTNHLRVGAPILEVADVLHIVEGETDYNLDDNAYLCEPDENGIMEVKFKKGLSLEDKLFDFAHECAHRINGDPLPNTRPDGINKPQIEQIADYTAAALLMPLDSMKIYLERNKYFERNSSYKYKIVHSLCKKYGVSELIALRRINEVQTLLERH